jgi:uroporphyrinogen decarboxylase
MTAREIITNRLNFKGTEITPYVLHVESGLYAKLSEYYKDGNWQANRLRCFEQRYLEVDTQQHTDIDGIHTRDVFGAVWQMDKKPWHLKTPPLAEPTLAGYDFPKITDFTDKIFKEKPEAIQKYLADEEHYRVISMGWGVFENTWRLRGFENTLTDVITDEDYYREVCGKITECYVAMVRACADVPADAFLFGDDWGDQRGIIIGPGRWRKFIKPCWAKIYDEVHRQGKKVIQHSCGSVAEIYEDLIEIGCDCHESVQPEAAGMKPDEIKAKYGGRIAFWGCLGSQGILHHGTPPEIREEILRLHRLFKDDGGFVLQPAKPLVDEMDIDCAVAVVETLAELSN